MYYNIPETVAQGANQKKLYKKDAGSREVSCRNVPVEIIVSSK
jgi:hypothetical protein